MIKVLVVDDSAFMRNVLSSILKKSSEIEVVGTARNGEQALEMIRQAARVTEVPERLQGKDFRVLLPVQFSLEDQR